MRTPLNVYFTAFKSIFLSLSMHILPRMNVMLDFIWTLRVQLRGTRNKWTLQKILVYGRIRTTNTASLDFQRVPLTTRLLGQLTIYDKNFYSTYLRSDSIKTLSVPWAKGYTDNENKIIAYLQFGDWYHLHTRWLTQKKKFIMSYMSMTIYNIYSFCIYYCLYCLHHNFMTIFFLYIISL